MRKKKRITTRTFVLTAVSGSLLIMFMVMANTLWASRQTITATNEAVSSVSSFYLETMADHRARIITNLINDSFDEMEKALLFIDEEAPKTQEELQRTIGKVQSLLSLHGFALVDEENIVYTQYTAYTGRSRHEFLAKEQLTGRIINTVSQYGSSRQLCLAIPTPGLRAMGKPFKACFVQINISDIVELLALDDQGKTYFGLYMGNGGNLSGTRLGPVISDRNILEATKELLAKEDWQENSDHFANGEEGSMRFASGGVEETLFYIPIAGTGWEMAVLIRESVIQDQIRDISEKNIIASRDQILFVLVAVLILAAVLLLQLRALSRDKIEEEKEASRTFRDMANKDSMTGVRNKHAYSEKESAINQQIRNNEIQKLALVICDINGLKRVNDTQGHAAGDELIKAACAMICEYFTHGAVFRIGGDEFAVILQGKGYDTMEEVIRELNRKIEENIKENAVTFSVGYAVLEQTDRRLGDVFERADRMMYERKKELKQIRVL